MTVRPALIVSAKPVGFKQSILWTMMITNALRRDWPGDVLIPDHEAVGLPGASKIRTAKIASIEVKRVAYVGRLDNHTMARVTAALRATLGL